jgi:SAM-dependent methyltransferase
MLETDRIQATLHLDRSPPVSDSTVNTHAWDEDASRTFLDTADLFVPSRAEQIAALVGLIPAERDEAFTVVELGSGEGALAGAVLAAYPRCRYVGLDGSAAMREHARAALAQHGDRLELRPFELADLDWRRELPQPLRCVLSSLVIHHLPGEGKRQLFADLAQRLTLGGALLIADLVEPVNARAARLYAEQYDAIVREQSLALRGELSGFDEFQSSRWNYFRYDYGAGPESGDYPSPLADQLDWLRAAGLAPVDCFWLRAGHAVYGGFK